jgi:hypothetical protein
LEPGALFVVEQHNCRRRVRVPQRRVSLVSLYILGGGRDGEIVYGWVEIWFEGEGNDEVSPRAMETTRVLSL